MTDHRRIVYHVGMAHNTIQHRAGHATAPPQPSDEDLEPIFHRIAGLTELRDQLRKGLITRGDFLMHAMDGADVIVSYCGALNA